MSLQRDEVVFSRHGSRKFEAQLRGVQAKEGAQHQGGRRRSVAGRTTGMTYLIKLYMPKTGTAPHMKAKLHSRLKHNKLNLLFHALNVCATSQSGPLWRLIWNVFIALSSQDPQLMTRC
jgi:hypothetical protein